MKKKTLLLSVILMLGATMFFSSCGKDKACRCEVEAEDDYGYDYEDTKTFDKYDMEDDYRVDNCADLEDAIKDEIEDDGFDHVKVSCEPRK